MNTMRPSEKASEDIINRRNKFDENIKSGIKTAANIGTSALGLGIGTRILPFLSEHIPVELAIKGINKISPKAGEFLRRGLDKGLDAREGLNFMKNKIDQAQESKTPEQTNIIKQYSDKLHAFLDDQIKKGRPVLEAGAIAQSNPEYSKVIKKLEKDHKANWSSILQSVYGAGQEPTQQQPMQGQMQPNQKGGNDQALLSAIERILQM